MTTRCINGKLNIGGGQLFGADGLRIKSADGLLQPTCGANTNQFTHQRRQCLACQQTRLLSALRHIVG